MPRPSRPVAALVAALAAAVLVSSPVGCSLLDPRVDLGVDGVRATWEDQPGAAGRRTLLVVPEREAPPGGWPLVVVLHGLGSDPEFTARVTGFADAAARVGLVVALPEGEDLSWAAGSCCGTAAARGNDDVAVVRRVLERTTRTAPVDPRRRFLTGWSNGGMLTYRFLCTDAGLLAGAASVAGTDTADCDPSSPVPFLQVSGRLDDVVPLDGGPSSGPGLGPFPSARASVASVAAAAGCGGPAQERAEGVTTTRWAPCRDGVTVELDVVDALDHGWSLIGGYATTDRLLSFWGLA